MPSDTPAERRKNKKKAKKSNLAPPFEKAKKRARKSK